MLTLVAALMLLLPLLAALQYRWLGQVSEGERERLQASLRAGANRFSQDFDQEISRAYRHFQMDADSFRDPDRSKFAERYERWFDERPVAKLVGEVFWVEAEEGKPFRLARFNPAQKQFEPQAWPAEFASLRARLEDRAQKSGATHQRIEQQIQSLQSQIGVTIRGNFEEKQQGASTFTKAVIRVAPEPLVEDIPALLIPIITHPGEGEDLRSALTPPGGYLVVTLRLDYITQQLLPALAKRYLYDGNNLDYNAAVVSRRDPQKIIYQLGPPLPAEAFATGDAVADIGGLRFDDLDALFLETRSHLKERFGVALGNVGGPKPDRMPMVSYRNISLETPWRLVVKHRAGSLEAAVASTRRRSLAISFGILLLLGVSVALIVVSTRRAQRLAEQQMEFVAAVSHELRTPLAVIRSAGANLADGVIGEREQVKRYGALVESEGRRLTEMVEQVLEFAGAQSGRKTYELRPVEVGGLVESALAACRSLVEQGGFQVETEIQPGLPLVMADAAAMRNAIQNLLSNAMKYSGESRRIGIQAHSRVGERGAEVNIKIEDHGLGIAPSDLSQIFEPFYRSREVVAAQIHGNGLGLSLVKHIIEAHGGRVSVESAVGRGSSFTLHLPAVAQAGGIRDESTEGNYEQANFAR